MNTENIKKFIQLHYSDQRLAEVLAHAQDGKLSFYSCCCFIGSATANHALRGRINDAALIVLDASGAHLKQARSLPYGREAELEFLSLGGRYEPESTEADAQRRDTIIPILEEEIARREQLKLQQKVETKETVAV